MLNFAKAEGNKPLPASIRLEAPRGPRDPIVRVRLRAPRPARTRRRCRLTSCRTPLMFCFITQMASKEMAAFFCSACCAKIFSSCRLARWTAPIGMPVSTEIARILRTAASNGATLARLLSWVSRASDAANRAVSVFIFCFTADNARSGTRNSIRRRATRGRPNAGRLSCRAKI